MTTKLLEDLRTAVNSACTCGGGKPGCPACQVWHKFSPRLKPKKPVKAKRLPLIKHSLGWPYTDPNVPYDC